MAKKVKASPAGEEARLKKKVAERRGQLENPEGDAPFRRLHKRLKRLQRLRRRLAIRKQHAMGSKKAAAAAKTEAPAA
jgi:hypothetical protein